MQGRRSLEMMDNYYTAKGENMYIIKNAIKNIGRNKGRNGLMAIIIFAIILATAVSIIINATTGAIISDYKTRFSSEVSISANFEKLRQKGAAEKYEPLTQEQRIEYGKSEYLKKTNYAAEMLISPRGLHSLNESEADRYVKNFLSGSTKADGSKMPETELIKGKIIARDNPEETTDFKTGARKIVQGEIYKNLDECVVSEQYAKLNGLSVGDTIEIDSYYKNDPMPHDLKVTGIYMDNTMIGKDTDILTSEENKNNEILTSFETILTMEMFKEFGEVSAQYFLKDPSMLPAYEKELREKGLADYFNLTTDEKGYQRVVGPVEGMAKITNTFMIVVLILGSMILVVLSTLAIRERKYEIGVLRAMGMKKNKVAFGLLTEMLVVTGICLILGLGIGAVAAQPMADSLLANQVKLAEEGKSENYTEWTSTGLWETPDTTDAPPLSKLQVKLSSDAIMQIILISLALAGASSIVGILYITKYEPIKILSERN